ncbi:beta strand repeat-containing protein [Campylobacter fetus]|uniref:beta strand repeat-containing protein n=1 Tax=Campylobacter fetus TaxID=196 RepID=UPI001F27A002|nr:cell surface protein [Campylobacter fetus]
MLNKTDVSMLYITIMGMASEGDGNKYWLDYANNNSLGVSSLANIMLDSPGAAKFFGDSLLAGNEKDFVTKIYSIALGNTSDVDGINYWTKAITGGGEFTDSKGNVISVASLSKGDLIGAMINSMVNGGSAESKAIFEAKAAASDYFADATLGKDISGLDEGTTSKLISEINSASDLDKVKSEIDGLKESIDEAGLNKIALTTENDTITGTEGGDLISGVVGSLASENTLNAGDVIDGGAGSDILKVDLKSNFTGLDSSGVIKGVEKISLLNSGLISRTFDAKGIKDVQTLALNSEKGIEVKNLANIADIELTNLQAANFNVDSIYADKVLDGSADVQNLKVNGVGAKGASVAITADKIENLSLNATGKDSFLKDITSKDVSVKGNANITLEVKAGVNSLDASASSGKVSADLKAADVKTVKGGSGDDKFVVGTKVANVNVDGGAGNDELEINGAGTLKPTVANVEKVTLDATGALTLAMDNAKDVSELNIKGDKGAVTVVNSNISSLNFLSTAEGTNAVTIDSENLATINYKAGTEAAEIKGNLTATKATNLTVNTDALANITSTGATITANSATSMSLNINAEKTAQSLKLSATKLKDLAVVNKSVDGFTIKGDANSLDALSNLNVTTDGKFSFDTITGLAGVSTVTLSGANDKSAVTLGDLGSDKVTQGIALNASGLKGGLEVGNTVTKGSININLNAMSGDAKLGAANSITDNLSISVNGVEGKFETQALKAAASTTVSLTNIKGASTIASLNGATTSLSIENTGDVTISNASSALEGDFSINANNANGLTTGVITANKGAISINANGVSAISVGNLSAKSSITLNAGDASTSVKAGDIAADSVNVDLSKVLGTTTVGKITSDNIIYKASELSADTEGKIALASKGNIQNFKAEVTGSLGDDKIELTTAATTSSVTLSGDLGVGNDTVDINETSAVDALKTVNLSGLTNYATSTTKLKAAANDTLTFNGGSGDDSVEVSGTAIASLKVIGDFGGGNLDKLTLGTNTTAITGADSAVTIDITKVTNVDSTEINFTNTATDMSSNALTIKGSESNDQVTLKLAATTKVKVDGDLGDGNDTFVFNIGAATNTAITDIDLIGLKGVEVGLHGADAATAFDFSGYTGLTTFNATTGADNIKLGTLTESAVVNLGSGDDKIETGAFTASKTLKIAGGEGNDTFDIKASVIVTVGTPEFVEITDFSAGDKITFGAAIAYENKGIGQGDTLKAAAETILGTSDTANTVYGFTYNNDTYLLYNAAGGSTATLTTSDLIVKLSGTTVNLDSLATSTNDIVFAS